MLLHYYYSPDTFMLKTDKDFFPKDKVNSFTNVKRLTMKFFLKKWLSFCNNSVTKYPNSNKECSHMPVLWMLSQVSMLKCSLLFEKLWYRLLIHIGNDNYWHCCLRCLGTCWLLWRRWPRCLGWLMAIVWLSTMVLMEGSLCTIFTCMSWANAN